MRPENTAVLSSGQQSVTLRCRTNNRIASSAVIGWSHTLVSGGASNQTVFACKVDPRIHLQWSVYNVTRDDSTGQCDLVINDVQPAVTGIYTCFESPTVTASAHVTIIC